MRCAASLNKLLCVMLEPLLCDAALPGYWSRQKNPLWIRIRANGAAQQFRRESPAKM
jgi:hypothetical protein